ncbi:hypothetical protein BT93_D1462 [Corymbia citriodora subsp. variegata]|nr:hypothetical protein BT93_D1462 [Corymbia citriodora subsp. variegata]
MEGLAMYVDEEEVWKCAKHPTRRRRSGICPKCLRERLDGLCPDCANLRPCSCCASLNSSSSSSSSSFSRFFAGDSAGTVGKVSNLIDSEPSFRRSRSVAVSFFRSRSKFVRDLDAEIGAGVGDGDGGRRQRPADSPHRTSSFFGLFRRDKSRRTGAEAAERAFGGGDYDDAAAERATMMRKSRSVAVGSNPLASGIGGGAASAKGRSWHFPSPMKVFRQTKMTKVVGQERSPLYRG